MSSSPRADPSRGERKRRTPPAPHISSYEERKAEGDNDATKGPLPVPARLGPAPGPGPCPGRGICRRRRGRGGLLRPRAPARLHRRVLRP